MSFNRNGVVDVRRGREPGFNNKAMKKLVFFVVLMLLVVAGGWAVYTYERMTKDSIEESAIKQLVAEGDKALNIGRYADAKRVFTEELKINPKNVQAAWGLKKAQVRELLPGPEFKAAADALFQENPQDGHVSLFLGEFYAAHQEPDKAQNFYRSAFELNPNLAEAHYALALLKEQLGDLNGAQVEYLKAISLSPEAKYHNSLATNYFKRQQFEKAIKEYGKNLLYPFSSLESAKIFWRLGYLSQALGYQLQAVELLENELVMTKPENQDAWFLEIAPGQMLKLTTLEEKKSYGYLNLAATLFLQGNPEEVEKLVQKARDFKLALQPDINNFLSSNLDTMLQGNAEVAELREAFKKSYLQIAPAAHGEKPEITDQAAQTTQTPQSDQADSSVNPFYLSEPISGPAIQ